jgi:nitrite reductase/ring-hydroxylating ferredoxin subunit
MPMLLDLRRPQRGRQTQVEGAGMNRQVYFGCAAHAAAFNLQTGAAMPRRRSEATGTWD